jgi:phosphodiesterase/alkaline phosphatase D-like protein
MAAEKNDFNINLGDTIYSDSELAGAAVARTVPEKWEKSVAKPSCATGLYRSVRWGKNLELFFLDERSFRRAKATQVCGGDLAPTAPLAARDAFATLAPALRNPVSPACTAAINDPSRTMLGARQNAAFTKRSKPRWRRGG